MESIQLRREKTTDVVNADVPELNIDWKEKNIKTFGVDLSFSNVPEWQRTKHVHRLHSYLGKFIPQLVEVFLKKYFRKGETILDPFLGSGTTLIEANVLGLHSVGIELSEFGYLIAKIKTQKYDIPVLQNEIKDILNKTQQFSRRLRKGEKTLSGEPPLMGINNGYFKEWYSERAAQEIFFYRNHIENYHYQDILKIILSRSARSARQIPHYDLARPKTPVKEKYWCIKHKGYCYPINEALKFINRYSLDTIKRIKDFDRIRTNSKITLLKGDSRTIELDVENIDGIFTSPPYYGLIDYHDQHRYAYELFKFKERLGDEIGSPTNGKKTNGREKYKQDIIGVFGNMSKYLKENAKIFVVVNDKYNLYPEIAGRCGFTIKDAFRRPVLCRTERDNYKFSESIYYFVKEG